MSANGSETDRGALPIVSAIVLLVLGLGAMLGTARLTASQGLRTLFLLSELALVAPGLLVLALRPVPVTAAVGLRRLDQRRLLYALGAGLALWVASIGLFELQAVLWPPDASYLDAFRRIHDALRPNGLLDALVSIAAIAVVPAICEETLLRGILLPSLDRVAGSTPAVLMSALLFAAIHLDLYRFAFTFGVGIALGVLKQRSGSLLAPVLAHALLNTVTFAVAPFADDPSAETASPLLGVSLLFVGTLLSIGAIRAVGAAPPADRPSNNG
jgi:membrane protease YdiL (CAAX protease family)